MIVLGMYYSWTMRGWQWMWSAWALLGILLLIMVLWLIRYSAYDREDRSQGLRPRWEDTPEIIVKKRYARGEIDAQQYQRMLEDLRK